MFAFAISAEAMTYEQARKEALFLTDKMAYELNLTNAQYEAAYEINLDYLMSVTGRSDVFGTYWERRNLDMSYILLDWQLRAYRAAAYFYRPLYWDAGYWHFGIYARYPRRHYLYFGRPAFYSSYRGGHSWRMNGGRSYYHGRRHHFTNTGSRNHGGMRDGWNKGNFKHNSGRGSGSSTRVTVNNGSSRGSFGQRRDDNRRTHNVDRQGFGTHNDRNRVSSDNASRSNNTVRNRGSFSSNRSTGTLRSGNSSTQSRSNSSSVGGFRNNRNNSSVNPSRSTSSHRSSAHTSSSHGTSSRGSNGGGRFGGQR